MNTQTTQTIVYRLSNFTICDDLRLPQVQGHLDDTMKPLRETVKLTNNVFA